MNSITVPINASTKTAELINLFNAKLTATSTLGDRAATLRRALELAKKAVREDPSEENLTAFAKAKSDLDLFVSVLPDANIPASGVEEKRNLELATLKLREAQRAYDSEVESSLEHENPLQRGKASDETIAALDAALKEVESAQASIPKSTGAERQAFVAKHLETPDFWQSVCDDLSQLGERFNMSLAVARQNLATAVSQQIIDGEDFMAPSRTMIGVLVSKQKAIVQSLQSYAERGQGGLSNAKSKKEAKGSRVDVADILAVLNFSPEKIIEAIEAKPKFSK